MTLQTNVVDSTVVEEASVDENFTPENNQCKQSGKREHSRFVKLSVLVCGFLCLFLSDGFINHLSLLFLEFEEEFQTSKAETSTVQSVASATFHIGGLFGGLLTTRFGPGVTGSLGASLQIVGLAISFLAVDIPYLVVSLGLLCGLGTSFTYVFSVTQVGHTFTGKELFIALSVNSFGSGIGSMVLPYVINALTYEYGWRGALLLLAAIDSHLIVIVIYCSRIALTANPGNNNKTVKGTLKILASILRNKIFMVFSVSFGLCVSVIVVTLLYFFDIFIYKGFGRSEALSAYLAMAICNVVTRPVPGLLKMIPGVGGYKILIMDVTLLAIALGIFPMAQSLSALIGLSCVIGFCLGTYGSLAAVGPMDILGDEKYDIGQGITLSCIGLSVLSLGPMIGLVFDVTSSYEVIFYGASVLVIINSIILTVVGTIQHFSKHRSRREQTIDVELTGPFISNKVLDDDETDMRKLKRNGFIH